MSSRSVPAAAGRNMAVTGTSKRRSSLASARPTPRLAPKIWTGCILSVLLSFLSCRGEPDFQPCKALDLIGLEPAILSRPTKILNMASPLALKN